MEVDLLLSHPEGHYRLVEVKAISDWCRAHFRLSRRQQQRLLRVSRGLIRDFGWSVEACLTLVCVKKKIVEVPFGDF